MTKVENGVGKRLYKIELLIIKFIPYIIALLYIANNILSYFGIDLPILSLIGGTSILVIIFLFVSSFVFKFCIYHRIPIYYIVVSDIIAYYDILFGIPLSDRGLFTLHLILIGIFLLLLVYFKFKQHEQRTSK